MRLVQCFSRINGPQTLGRGLGFWVPFAFVLLIAFAFPMFSDDYTTGNVAYFFTWLFMAAGLCLMWGLRWHVEFWANGLFRNWWLYLRSFDYQLRRRPWDDVVCAGGLYHLRCYHR